MCRSRVSKQRLYSFLHLSPPLPTRNASEGLVGFCLRCLPAAAAGSWRSGVSLGGDDAGAGSRSLDSGLLSRAEPSLLARAGGDRERRSNLEALRGSGSFWSKRERLAVRRSVSSIVLWRRVDVDHEAWKEVAEMLAFVCGVCGCVGRRDAGVEDGWNFRTKRNGASLVHSG